MKSLFDYKSAFETPPQLTVTLTMPTHTGAHDTGKDKQIWRNLIREAELNMARQGLPSETVETVLSPARQILEDIEFWAGPEHGTVGIFKEDSHSIVRAPYSLPEASVVSLRPYLIGPALAEADNGSYFLLAVSRNLARLFKCDRYDIIPMAAPEMPENMEDALGGEELEKQFQARGHPNQGTFGHGHDTDSDVEKDRTLRYFRAIDKGIRPVLNSLPLVLATVDYFHPIYYKANSYAHLMMRGVVGNPDELRPDQLRDEAWKVVGDYFAETARMDLGHLQQKLGTGLATTDLMQILPAVATGRVEALFVPPGARVWGKTADMEFELSDDGEDLWNWAALGTLAYGGRIHAGEPGALLRG